MNPSLSYDQDSQVLSIRLKDSPSVDSDMQGNVVLDYGEKGEVVAVNVYKVNFDAFKEAGKNIEQFAKGSQKL